MTCPVCGEKTIVIGSKSDCETIHRRRMCKECRYFSIRKNARLTVRTYMMNLWLRTKKKGENMIKIEQTDVYGWEAAIRGMRNPLNSWEKSDSHWDTIIDEERDLTDRGELICQAICRDNYIIGENDYNLMMKLAHAGASHSKYRRMITVTCDITAPFYWWKEFDTYKVGTVANSCSTMHKIHAKEFTLDDFSCEHLSEGEYGNIEMLKCIITCLNVARVKYMEDNDKDQWWQMIQLLPTSYNQKRTVQLNYEVLANIYHDRKNHKLDEWHTFCEWIRSLPYSELITGEVICCGRKEM